jgi:hypothetical protein
MRQGFHKTRLPKLNCKSGTSESSILFVIWVPGLTPETCPNQWIFFQMLHRWVASRERFSIKWQLVLRTCLHREKKKKKVLKLATKLKAESKCDENFPKRKFSSEFGHSFSEKKNFATEHSHYQIFMFWQNYAPKKKMVQIWHICI